MRRNHAAHDGMRMPTWMRRWVFVSGAACLLTGVLWLLFHHFVRHEGAFGPEAHPLEHTWLTLHGGAAIFMTWVFGLIWLPHVRRGWQRKRNLVSGATMASSIIVLAASGWGLYYLGDELWRAVVSALHWSIGLAGGAWLPIHIWRGRRSVAPEPRTQLE